MSEPQVVSLYATKSATKDQNYLVSLGDRVVIGSTPGDACFSPKLCPNEDSATAFTKGSAIYAMVADAHFGPRASEYAIDMFSRSFRNIAPNEKSLCRAVQQCNGWIWDTRDAKDKSETTGLAVVVVDRTVVWASAGDSRLLLIDRNGPAQSLVVGTSVFMGSPLYVSQSYPGSVMQLPEDAIEHGTFPIKSTTHVLAVSDGIDTEASGLSLDDIADIVRRAQTPTQAMEELLSKGGYKRNGGGGDNLTGILIFAEER